jgi:hypothetical protein
MTDERLLEQAASGDETAFAVIYERHRGNEHTENVSNNLAIHALTCHHLAAFR